MNLKSAINIFILAGLIFFAACSKKGSDQKTKTELIATSSWKYSQAGIDQDGNGTIDITAPASLVQACVTDNIVTFKSDKTGTVDEGPTKCNTTDLQTTSFTWSLSADESQITFSGPIIAGITGDAKIIELTESKFVLSKTLSVTGLPIPVPVVVVLVH